MFKKILSLAIVAVTTLFASAQTPLPLNPDVKHGTLANGLNYYILHNEEPKQRANFYIAQKVGSTLETPEQLGLAHFLEHMAFNGTKNYPGKAMLNYLQGKGIRFGADINAYTAFDETVYRINNVPTTDEALMDSCLLVLFDWSGNLLLEEDEINAERGVIEEEWRSRNTATQRMYEAILPQIYQEYQYRQMPIGDIEIVRNFPPQVLRDYYHKWYRPDQQGIVVVGDFDADAMEKKVVELFSKIVMPENAAPREYPNVSDNQDPIYAYYADKELQYPMVTVSFKSEKLPFELRNTVEGFVQTAVIQEILCEMINNRLQEYASKPECNYMYAGTYFGDFWVSKTKDAFNIRIIAKNDARAAYNDAMAIVARACKTGFMQSEVTRSRDELIANYEKAYNERNNTDSHDLGQELCRHFVDNEPAPGREMELNIAKQLLQMVPVEAYNQMAAEILTPENQVIVVGQPETDSMTVITKEEMTGDLQKVLNADYEPYVDEVITEPLIAKLPKAGKVKTEAAGEFGTTVFTLSNGVKVVVKPTDYKQDEILFQAFKVGGKDIYTKAEAPDVQLAAAAVESSKLGNFDQVKLSKYLAGKKVELGYEIGNTSTALSGKTSVKDLPTMMELVYAYFTAINPDEATYQSQIDQIRSVLANADKDANTQFQRHFREAMFNNNPLYNALTIPMIDASDYNRELALAKASLKNAADYTFVFTGNVDVNVLKPLLEQYVATLPVSKKKTEVKIQNAPMIASGEVVDQFDFPMQAPSTMVLMIMSDNNVAYSIENDVMIDLLGEIVSNVYTETLREEEGGTYSPYAYGSFNPFTGQWMLLSNFQTNADMKQKLIDRANAEVRKILNNGATEDQFNKVREAAAKQYENSIRTNRYWLSNLVQYERGVDGISGHKAAIDNLTLEQFNGFLKNLYNGKNLIEVVLNGVQAEQK